MHRLVSLIEIYIELEKRGRSNGWQFHFHSRDSNHFIKWLGLVFPFAFVDLGHLGIIQFPK